MVPDQFTLEAERELFAHSGAKALMDVEVISMSRLGYRLLEELGGSKRTFIDKYGRHMILAGIASRKQDRLEVFKGMEDKNSFIELVNNFISEMKQFNCGAAELAEIAGSVPEGSYTRRKLEDLHLLFCEYEEAIRGKYTDSEDYIDLFLGKIGKSELIAGNHIWIYGFDSFAPKAMSVIGEMLEYAAEVNLVITYDENCDAQSGQGAQGSRGAQGKTRDAELFALAGVVIRNFEKLAESRGVAVKKQAIPKEYRAERAEKIRFIERELYALPARKYDGGDADSLSLVAAANLYNEAESAACYVLSLVRDFGYRYSDIKVICNDQETRGPILRRVFKEYGIDLISDASKDIMQSGIVQYIMALMDLVIERCRTDIVIKMLKSGFGDVTNDGITDLENYAIKYKIRGSMWKKPFLRGESEYGAEGMERLNLLREKALAFLPELAAVFKAESCGEFIGCFYEFLYEKVKLPEKIEELIAREEAQGRPDLAEETAQIWDKVIGIFDQMAEIMGGQKFRAAAFRSLFEVGISQVKIGILPPTQDGLMMGTMQRSRTGRMRALVVVGANEGILPSEKQAPGLFASDERKLFKDKGIEICKVDDVRVLEERMGIYRNLSRPSERLWISYSMSDADGGPSRPSGVFAKLARQFGNTPVARDALNRESDAELAVAGPAGLRHLTEALQTACEGKPLAPHWQATLDWYKKNNPQALVPIRKGLSFTNKQEDLGREIAAALYMPELPKTGSAPNPATTPESAPNPATTTGSALTAGSALASQNTAEPPDDAQHIIPKTGSAPNLDSAPRTESAPMPEIPKPGSAPNAPNSSTAPNSSNTPMPETPKTGSALAPESTLTTGSAPSSSSAPMPGLPKTGSAPNAPTAPTASSATSAPNQSYSAPPPTALSLSPSRLERFSRCPFSHFVQYGLRPEERRIFEIAPREIGDIYHECLMEIARHLTASGLAITDPASPWMTISRQECRGFVEKIIAGKTCAYREGLLSAGNEEKYRTERITDICDKVCWAMISQVRAGKIEGAAFEASFGRGRQISPITVELSGARQVYIEGKIDRIDYLPAGRVKIIDYKTGDESFSITEAKAGYRLQLMLYLEAALEHKRKPAGVFYFKISEPMIDTTGTAQAEEEIAEKIQKSFRLNGVIVDNPDVIRSVAGEFSGISCVAPIRINKEGIVSGAGEGNLLTEDEFDKLRAEVGEKVREICNRLADGGLQIHPMKTKNTSACAFCQYKGICRFDTIFEGCKYNIIK